MSPFNTDSGVFSWLGVIITFSLSIIFGTSGTKVASFDAVLCLFKGSLFK